MNDKPFSRRAPQTAYTEKPAYYETDDIAHVLARVRFMREFMEAIDHDDILRPMYTEIHCRYMDLLEAVLAPYALDLAISLVELEDSLAPPISERAPSATRRNKRTKDTTKK